MADSIVFDDVRKGDVISLETVFTVIRISKDMKFLEDNKGLHYYPKNYTMKLVNRTPESPVYWPPLLGDIWEIQGREWMYEQGFDQDGCLWLVNRSDVPDGMEYCYDEEELDELLKYKPKLVRRKDFR